jgi:uncharacterized protein YbcI
MTAISNAIVGLMREYHGRGPMKAKTYAFDDLIVCVLRNGMTKAERTMIEGGHADRVLRDRREFQELMSERYRAVVEELTGSSVLAVMSQSHVDPDVTVEIFLVDPPLDQRDDEEREED